MEWPEVRQRLLDAAAMLKERKAVDIGIKSLLGLIPVVGGFVSEYWDRLDVPGEAQASELAAVLARLAAQEDLFERVEERLQSQGNQLLQIGLPISQIVSEIETIADDTQYTRRMLEHWDAALRFGPARAGMALGLAMVEDARGSGAFVEQVRHVVGQLGGRIRWIRRTSASWDTRSRIWPTAISRPEGATGRTSCSKRPPGIFSRC